MWCDMTCDMKLHDMTWHVTWCDVTCCDMIWCDITWHVTWYKWHNLTCDMSWPQRTCHVTCLVTWQVLWHDMTCDMSYDMWHDMTCDMTKPSSYSEQDLTCTWRLPSWGKPWRVLRCNWREIATNQVGTIFLAGLQWFSRNDKYLIYAYCCYSIKIAK